MREVFVDPFTPHYSHFTSRKSAFTLAEVLITLGIIGVVAAMTLPTLVNDKQNKELQTQFKKTYSELNQVARLFYNDNGISVSEYTAYTNGQNNLKKFLNEFPKYMKGVSVISDWTHNDYDEDNTQIDTMPYPIHAVTGSKDVKMICDVSGFRSDISGRLYAFNDPPNAGQNGPVVCVDINGEKKPNRYGMDIFLFVFTTDGFVIPMGQDNKNNVSGEVGTASANFFSKECRVNTSEYRQFGCAAYALADKNPEGEGDYWNVFLKSAK